MAVNFQSRLGLLGNRVLVGLLGYYTFMGLCALFVIPIVYLKFRRVLVLFSLSISVL